MYGVVIRAHPVRGESHNQRNTTGGVATLPSFLVNRKFLYVVTIACFGKIIDNLRSHKKVIG